jgi:pimeloyl-ACP methyl ester carboxylesterase
LQTRDVTVGPDITLHVAIGGSGSPVVLLHGFPQTHLMWRHVAPLLASQHTVICPDLRGYGASCKPPAASRHTYSKRTMATDVIGLADALDLGELTLVGHDRGALVAFRAGLDHPDRIGRLLLLDVVPTVDTWAVLNGVSAAVAFHLFLMAQPQGLPETLIGNSADEFFGWFLDAWSKNPAAIPPDVRAEYLAASRGAVASIVADYRATATIDLEDDQASVDAGEQLHMPVSVVQQDWGAQLDYDPAARWRRWAPDLEHYTTEAGHFMAEEAPDDIATLIRALIKR